MTIKSLAIVALLATTSTAAIAATAMPAAKGDLQQQMSNTLANDGYSNVQVTPGSFFIRATNRSGDPVRMVVTPNAMVELVSDTGTSNMNANAPQGNAQEPQGSLFRTIPSGDELSSKVVGIDVYNMDNRSIGQIKDIAFANDGRINGYILSVGGFLGIGDHYVAVKPSSVDLTWNASAKTWHAKMDATAAQLKAAPEYKYAS